MEWISIKNHSIANTGNRVMEKILSSSRFPPPPPLRKGLERGCVHVVAVAAAAVFFVFLRKGGGVNVLL